MSPASVTLLMNDIAALRADNTRHENKIQEQLAVMASAIRDGQTTAKEMFDEIRATLKNLDCKKPRKRKSRAKCLA